MQHDSGNLCRAKPISSDSEVCASVRSVQADPLTKTEVIDGTKLQLQCLSAQLLFPPDLKIEPAIAQLSPGKNNGLLICCLSSAFCLNVSSLQ